MKLTGIGWLTNKHDLGSRDQMSREENAKNDHVHGCDEQLMDRARGGKRACIRFKTKYRAGFGYEQVDKHNNPRPTPPVSTSNRGNTFLVLRVTHCAAPQLVLTVKRIHSSS